MLASATPLRRSVKQSAGRAGGVTQTARQFGGALGLAAIFAILGEPSGPADAYSAYKWGFAFIMVTSIVACLLASQVKQSQSDSV